MLRLRFMLLMAFVCLALPAFAEEPGTGGVKAAHGDHKAAIYEVTGHGADGKQFVKQFDTSKPAQAAELSELIAHGHVHEMVNHTPPTIGQMASLSAELGIWTLIIFCGLLFVLSKMAWPKMVSGLQKREENIRSAITEAEKAKTEAQALRVSLQKEMDLAHEKVKAVIDEGKRDAQVTATEMITKAKEDINLEKERLRRELQVETDQALQSLWTKAAELATQASAAAIGKDLTTAGHSRLIDDALGELKRVGANGR